MRARRSAGAAPPCRLVRRAWPDAPQTTPILAPSAPSSYLCRRSPPPPPARPPAPRAPPPRPHTAADITKYFTSLDAAAPPAAKAELPTTLSKLTGRSGDITRDLFAAGVKGKNFESEWGPPAGGPLG